MTEFRIWQGIEPAFPEAAPTEPDAFFSARWEAAERKRVGAAIAALDGPEASRATLIAQLPLPAMLAPLVATHRPLRVLDFGGGAGELYTVLEASLPGAALDVHIVETATVCALGRDLFAGRPGPTFHEKAPDEPFDVVHAASSLHYVADWRGQLARFAAAEPSLVVLAGLTAGDIPTFVTWQTYYEHRIPVWFWNAGEIIAAMADLGYRLVYRSLLNMAYLGNRGPLPMQHFPPSHRLPRKCNLAFVPEAR